MNKKNFTISRMICTNCGKEGIPIPRKTSQTREQGHLKDLYCPNCKAYHNHQEIRSDWDRYRLEEQKEPEHEFLDIVRKLEEREVTSWDE